MCRRRGYLVFVESDDTITSDYLEEKLKAAEKYPDASIIYNDVNLTGATDCPRALFMKSYIDVKKKYLISYTCQTIKKH